MIKRIYTKIISAASILFFAFFSFAVVSAAGIGDAFSGQLDTAAGGAGYNTTETGANTVEQTIGMVIQVFLSIIGVIFLILMIYAGYSWMTAHGDEQKVTKAKETITASIIGLAIVIGAYAITYFIISKLTTGTLTSS